MGENIFFDEKDPVKSTGSGTVEEKPVFDDSVNSELDRIGKLSAEIFELNHDGYKVMHTIVTKSGNQEKDLQEYIITHRVACEEHDVSYRFKITSRRKEDTKIEFGSKRT